MNTAYPFWHWPGPSATPGKRKFGLVKGSLGKRMLRGIKINEKGKYELR